MFVLSSRRFFASLLLPAFACFYFSYFTFVNLSHLYWWLFYSSISFSLSLQPWRGSHCNAVCPNFSQFTFSAQQPSKSDKCTSIKQVSSQWPWHAHKDPHRPATHHHQQFPIRCTTRHKTQTDRQVLYLTLEATFHFSHSFVPTHSRSPSLSLTSPFITPLCLSLFLYYSPSFSVGLTFTNLNHPALSRARSLFCLAACVSIPLALCVPSPSCSCSCSECLFVISHFN